MAFTTEFNSAGRPFPIPLQPLGAQFDPDSIGWWHSIPLPGGRVTQGGKSRDIMQDEAGHFFNTIDLSGKSFLDIGAWNGGFTLEAFQRGASRIAALDRYHLPEVEQHFQALTSINYIAEQWNIPAELYACNLDNPRVDLSVLGRFDVVLFSGVFYHLLNPLSALREVAMLAKDVLIIETLVDNTNDDRPGMIFYPRDEVNHDVSNWWGPNIPFVVEYLQVLGYSRVEVTYTPGSTRGIFHAYRDVQDQFLRPDINPLEVSMER